MYFYVYEQYMKANRLDVIKNVLMDYNARADAGVDPALIKSLKIGEGSHGKPFFEEIPEVKFSISHSGSWWGCLMTDRPVGVDLEDLEKRDITYERYLAISNRFFTEDERIFVSGNKTSNIVRGENSGDEPDWDVKMRFFHVWTRKEAYVKYLGTGLGEGLSNFSVFDENLKVSFHEVPITPTIKAVYCCEAGLELNEIVML